jgi:hypothetical protein
MDTRKLSFIFYYFFDIDIFLNKFSHQNGVRPNGFPETILDLETAEERLLNIIILHYNLHPANAEIRDKVRLIKRFLGLVV